ncbi:hypothetical protein MTR_7g063350 [Medicago truncatula]|uniref:Uncharacterized protein n=1 Tax=Medicago truncatula TaxID=3880 RepID=A0A072UAY0_MEDTR|nr:hypothetical protein MTR_7g063350 [Medicago truncatula]
MTRGYMTLLNQWFILRLNKPKTWASLADSTDNYVIYIPHKEYKQTKVWQAERILDGLSLGAKERDLEPIGHKNMKIERQNMSPTSQKLGTARASLGTAVPPSRVSFAAFA